MVKHINDYLFNYIIQAKFIALLFLFASKYNITTHKSQLEAAFVTSL